MAEPIKSMRDDERQLLVACLSAGLVIGQPKDIWPRDIAIKLGIAPKRAGYLFEKWAGKGWYDYGISVDMGWLEQKGVDQALAELFVPSDVSG